MDIDTDIIKTIERNRLTWYGEALGTRHIGDVDRWLLVERRECFEAFQK